MKNKSKPSTSSKVNKTKTSGGTTSKSSASNTSSSKKTNTKTTNDKNSSSTNKTPKNTINENNSNTTSNREKIILDLKELFKPSSITTNENVNFTLYLELMNNLDKKDDLKTLAICRLILTQEPNNTKIKELHDVIYEKVKEDYYQSGELEPPKEEQMDRHMRLNKDGEYEYYFSDESEEDEKE